MDKALLIKEIKSQVKYLNKEIKNRTIDADTAISNNNIVKWFEGQKKAYNDMLEMIVKDAPRL